MSCRVGNLHYSNFQNHHILTQWPKGKSCFRSMHDTQLYKDDTLGGLCPVHFAREHATQAANVSNSNVSSHIDRDDSLKIISP
jgi:hypothetical protein